MLVPSLEPLTALVADLKRVWRAGAEPDAVGALAEYPELLRHRSLVVDLAYEEYCLREEAGAAPEADAFCDRLPAFRSYVREIVRGHRLLADHPELLAGTPVWPQPGDQIEQVTVVRELGRGAFARVYLAREPDAGDRHVVLKLAHGRSGEARTLGPISHPHIVPVLWARPTNGLFAMCMPFVSAATLRDGLEAAFRAGSEAPTVRALIDPIAVPELLPAPHPVVVAGRESYPDAVAAVAVRLAGAVEHLHAAGIVHGDLKPSNVLLAPGGQPFLIDFNLSTALSESPLRCGGTIPYMPPERLRLLLGNTHERVAGTAGDVYSFGAVLFEALTGRVPLEPINETDTNLVAADLLLRITEGRAPAGSHPGVPAPLAALIDRCLELNPDRRPPIAEVRVALERYLARRARWARRALGAALGLVVFGAAVWSAASLRVGPAQSVSAGEPAPSLVQFVPRPAAPVTADDFFAQGVVNLKSGHVSAAIKDFGDANRLRPDGPNTAHLAYALSLSGQTRPAVDLYRKAIDDHGYAPAWVRNNLAYALLRSAPTTDAIRQAEAEATTALASAPTLRPARLNRLDARYRLALNESAAPPGDPAMLAELESVMRDPPHTADLYVRAAVMTVAFGGGRDENNARAVSYLEEAVRLGQSPKPFGTDRLLKGLGGRADFQRLSQLTPGTPAANPANPYLAAPPLN